MIHDDSLLKVWLANSPPANRKWHKFKEMSQWNDPKGWLCFRLSYVFVNNDDRYAECNLTWWMIDGWLVLSFDVFGIKGSCSHCLRRIREKRDVTHSQPLLGSCCKSGRLEWSRPFQLCPCGSGISTWHVEIITIVNMIKFVWTNKSDGKVFWKCLGMVFLLEMIILGCEMGVPSFIRKHPYFPTWHRNAEVGDLWLTWGLFATGTLLVFRHQLKGCWKNQGRRSCQYETNRGWTVEHGSPTCFPKRYEINNKALPPKKG